MRIRHFGFLANRSKKQALGRCRKLFDLDPVLPPSPFLSAKDLLLKIIGVDLSRCPCCREGTMIVVGGSAGFVELTSLGFFMNEPLSDFISGDSRSGGLARVGPALSKTGSEAAWQSRSHGKTIGTNLNLDLLNVLSLTLRHTRRDCETLQSP